MTKDSSTQDSRWEAQAEQAVTRYRQRLDALRADLGPHAGIVEVERLLMQHENALMRDALEALTEGTSPPHDAESDP